jgi:hypothetical protein
VSKGSVSGGGRDDLAEVLGHRNGSSKKGGHGLEDSLEFGEVHGGSRKHYVIRIWVQSLESGDGEIDCGEGGATMEVTEQNGIEHRSELLVELRGAVVASRVSGSSCSNTKDIGKDRVECSSGSGSKFVEGAREEIVL